VVSYWSLSQGKTFKVVQLYLPFISMTYRSSAVHLAICWENTCTRTPYECERARDQAMPTSAARIVPLSDSVMNSVLLPGPPNATLCD